MRLKGRKEGRKYKIQDGRKGGWTADREDGMKSGWRKKEGRKEAREG